MDAVHRLRWQWVILSFKKGNCLRYSRADYHIWKLIRLVYSFRMKGKRQMQIYSPFRRWTCGRIINTLSTYQPIENLFSRLPLQFEWIGTSLRELMWIAVKCNRPSWYTDEPWKEIVDDWILLLKGQNFFCYFDLHHDQ